MAATGIAEVVKAQTGGGIDGEYFATEDVTGYAPDAVGDALADKMTVLVKGVGYTNTHKASMFGEGGNMPLTEPTAIFGRAMRAEKAWKAEIRKGHTNPEAVYKSLSPSFAGQFGAFMSNNPQNMAMQQWVASLSQQLVGLGVLPKNTTLTSPLSTGFVPYNLVAPSRLIFPVYSPFRNKLPRTQGQGTSWRAKVITGISGSQTPSGSGGFVDIAIPELVQSGGSMNNWPLNLPASGSQTAVDLNVPYKFLGLSENVSWLAQFAGQGFEDVAALSNLILLQEMMLNEEAQLIAATSTALTTPSAVTGSARNANSGETALSGTITNNTLDIKVTAANYFGETAPSAVTAVTSVTSGTSVVDVVITPVAGALWYNIYVTVGTVEGTYHIMASQVGGHTYTLQGAVPTTGTLIPGADTGTYSTYRYEGLVPTLSGHSAGGSNVYPTGWQGGYVNQSVGDTLQISVINTALQQMWNGTGAYKADPAELVGEGSDIMRLSDDIIQAGADTNYRLFVTQTDTPGVRAGAAVSEFVNPVTRSIVRIVVHPWLPQGTAMLMTYQMPYAWSNVTNCWEVNNVQDYLSIAWPVIDATYRFSMFLYGALTAQAPQYSGLLQGLQRTDRSGSTGTWS